MKRETVEIAISKGDEITSKKGIVINQKRVHWAQYLGEHTWAFKKSVLKGRSH